jgi:hypothetical protein
MPSVNRCWADAPVDSAPIDDDVVVKTSAKESSAVPSTSTTTRRIISCFLNDIVVVQSTMSRQLVLCIEDEMYEVSQFVPNHPGEGIRNLYLTAYRHKNATREFDQFHNDNEPHQMLVSARALSADPKTGIRHIARNPFDASARRLPAYLRYARSQADADALFQDGNDAATLPFIAYNFLADGSALSLAIRAESPDQQNRHLRLIRDADSQLWSCQQLPQAESLTSLSKFIDSIVALTPTVAPTDDVPPAPPAAADVVVAPAAAVAAVVSI